MEDKKHPVSDSELDTKPPAKRLKSDVAAGPGPSPHNVAEGHAAMNDEVLLQQQHAPAPAESTETSAARLPSAAEETPDMADTESAVTPRAPVAEVQRATSSGSTSSDVSDASADPPRAHSMSPVPTAYVREVPPAPPSTPASHASTFLFDGAATPLPIRSNIKNADVLEQQHLLEGAATPAPTRPATTAGKPLPKLPEDFSDWAVGERYELVRMLGRGSYGEVAQAIDRQAGRPDAFVAIKRIQSPFEQEVDAIRLYREIHILRRMRGHDCIIKLLDIVQPPTDDIDDFNDLYMVFECTYTRCTELGMTSSHNLGFSTQMWIRICTNSSCRRSI